MLPDINAAVIGFALIRCVRGYRVVLAFVVKAHAAAADTVVGCILGHIVNAALRQIFVVLLRSIGYPRPTLKFHLELLSLLANFAFGAQAPRSSCHSPCSQEVCGAALAIEAAVARAVSVATSTFFS